MRSTIDLTFREIENCGAVEVGSKLLLKVADKRDTNDQNRTSEAAGYFCTLMHSELVSKLQVMRLLKKSPRRETRVRARAIELRHEAREIILGRTSNDNDERIN